MAKERRPGERVGSIPVEDWNEFVRMSKFVKEMQKNVHHSGNTDNVPQLTVQIVNKTGADIGLIEGEEGPEDDIIVARPVLAITKVLITIAESEHITEDILVFEGDTPDADTRISDLVIVDGPIPNNQTAGGTISGVTWVDVWHDVGDEDLQYADIKAGDNTQLKASASGIPILWKDTVPATIDLPARVKAVIGIGGGSAEKYRLIRGQSVGAQSGGTLLIDNVWANASGLDPSGGNSAVQVSVYNLFSQTYADNEIIQAVYSEQESAGLHWETLKKTATSEAYRLIRGLVVSDVTADDSTFTINGVNALANGLDPSGGGGAVEITVRNILNEALEQDTQVTCIYKLDTLPGVNWELLLVERFRLLRGEAYAGIDQGDTGTFLIDAIVPLSSGIDPRTNTTSATEQLSIVNIYGDAYAANDKVMAIYNTEANVWEAMPKGGGETKSYAGFASSAISDGSAAAPSSGSATVYQILAGSVTSLGTKVVKNPFNHEVKGDLSLTKIDNDTYLIVGYDLRQALSLIDDFGSQKYLGTPEGGSAPDDIIWMPTGVCGEIT